MQQTPRQIALEACANQLHEKLVTGFLNGAGLAVVKAPPGSGKTHLLLRVIGSLVKKGWRVAIGTQTNTQADDIVLEASRHEVLSNYPITRLTSQDAIVPVDPRYSAANWITSATDIPDGEGIVISTIAKWATVQNCPEFELFAVDESWQMKWVDIMRCATVSGSYFLIGDPGQIPPITRVDVARWGTSKRPPHKAAPEVALEQFAETAIVGTLPAVRRLPQAAVKYVRPFYDFDFDAYTESDDRVFWFEPFLRQGEPESQVEPKSSNFDSKAIEVLQKLIDFEPVMVTIPTPQDGPPPESDEHVAHVIRRIVQALTSLQVEISLSPGLPARLVSQSDIGVSSTHRAMNGLIRRVLGSEFDQVRIDTPERWQGLQKPLMIVAHPLSGTQEPTEFDLGTGRLCVMASRHQVGLIVVSRDHIFETLANTVTFATQPPGQPDELGLGKQAHDQFVELLSANDRIVRFA